MDIQALLTHARHLGAALTLLEGDRLKVQALEPLPEELVEELRRRKPEILALLQSGIMPELVGTVPVKDQSAEVTGVHEAETIQAVKITSTVLGDDIWLILDRSFIPTDGLAIYYAEEIPLLRDKTPEDLRQIHKAKLAFPGCRVIQEGAEIREDGKTR